MAKILLVEDDNNLREIYEARLQAEGYAIVSAKDGEEALVLAKSERPDLIISDVMMPRISGFEMLDILRNTEGLRDTKIIMLTALGQAEDKTRADSLGADKYLVKSQVTLEDIVKAAEELLNQTQTGTIPAPAAVTAPVSASAPVATAPATVTASPPATPVAQPAPAIPVAAPPAPNPAVAPVAPQPTPAVPPAVPVAPSPSLDGLDAAVVAPATPAAAAATQHSTPPVIQPPTNAAQPLSHSASSEAATVQAQINDFIQQPAARPANPAGPATSLQQSSAVANPSMTVAPAAPPPKPLSTSPSDTKATDQLVADAVKNLSSGNTPAAESPPKPPTTVAPTNAPTTNNQAENDAVAVAHKKVIAPIAADPTAPAKPGLSELLAREGLSDLDDTARQPDVAAGSTQPPYSTPHPPGHVISPSANGSVDPNSIAL